MMNVSASATVPLSPRLRELFERVVDAAPGDREAALRRCGANAAETDALRRMLAADHRETFLDVSAADWARQLDEEAGDVAALVGQRVGPYRILRLLGRGGSSVVFRASRMLGDSEQTVALKLMQSGLFSPESRRRFRREQAILSQLSHPHLAKLIDAGIAENGTPYIAMEEVDGMDLRSFAEAYRPSRDDRLRLMIDVCHAVEAAHRGLVVHRDLKPSNVLVTQDGFVKVVDFGIAKLLDEDEPATATQLVALTPGYAAPEQFDRRPVTTSTDVYALGVLIGELLLGTRLGPDASWPQLADGERTALARRWRRLDRDLVQMLRCALDSEPDRRYLSAGHLAADITRFLRHEPLAVSAVSALYRARKFVARHRTAVFASALLAVASAITVVDTLWQSALVNQQAARANAARDFLVSVFEAAGADLPLDKRPSVRDIVAQASTRLQAQGRLPDTVRADLLLTLARVSHSVGSEDEALHLLDRAEPLLVRLDAPDDSPRLQAKILRADVLSGAARNREVIAMLEPLGEAMAQRRDELGNEGLLLLADALMSAGRNDESLALIRQAQAIARSQRLDAALLRATIQEAQELLNAQRFRDALERADAAIALWHEQGEPVSPALIDLHAAIALAAEAAGDIPRAEAAYRQAIVLGGRFFDRPNPRAAWNIGMYGSFLIAQGRFAEGEPYALRGLQMRRELFGDTDPRTLNAVATMGKFYYGQSKFDEAEQWLTQGTDTCLAHQIRDVVCPRMLALRGRSYGRQARFAEAESDVSSALDLQREISGDATPAFAALLDNLLTIQLAKGEFAGAIVTADRALAIRSGAKGGMLQADLATRFGRAKALFELHRNVEALAELLDIEPMFSRLFPESGQRVEMLTYKARALARAERTRDAAEAARQALVLAARRPADAKVLGELKQLSNAAP